MGVGVPGTGMVGLPIAAAVGAIAGNSKAELEVLKDITDGDVAKAKQLIDSDKVTVGVAGVSNIIYAKVTIHDEQHYASVTIADSHTHIMSIEKDGMTLFIADSPINASNEDDQENAHPLANALAEDIYDYALNAPLEQIEFIEQSYRLNDALSVEGLTGNYGLQIGATFQRNIERGLLSEGLLTNVLSRTSAASDARMDGAMKPAMSNSGSGNQGIAATMPVVVVAEHLKVSRRKNDPTL